MRFSPLFWFCCGLLFHGQAAAQELRLQENFNTSQVFQVSCRVSIEGQLPVAADEKAKAMAVTGRSSVEYAERVLRASAAGVERTARLYSRLEFARKVGDTDQFNALRPEVARMVVLRKGPAEVPFSPDGPLHWGEIELVRTDVFVPALRGLLPGGPAKVRDRWNASPEALQELTDLERISAGSLTCELVAVERASGRDLALIRFEGKVQGIGEDGNAAHEIDGRLYFDLAGQHLAYLSMLGKHILLDKAGAPTATIKGTFVLTRSPVETPPRLSDAALAAVKLEPDDSNTQLAFDQPALGVRFLYGRNWRISKTDKNQVSLDEAGGNGVLVTLDPPNAQPNVVEFDAKVQAWLKDNKARVLKANAPRNVQAGMDVFGYEVELDRKRMLLHYVVLRQAEGGATLSARILAPDPTFALRDLDRLAKSMQRRTPR